MDYSVPDVSGEFVMDVAKVLANSPNPMSKEAMHNCFPQLKTLAYTENALDVCIQLGLAEQLNDGFVSASANRTDLKKATRNQLYSLFQQHIMNYPPFLLYIDFGSKGYTSADSAAKTRGILAVRGSLNVVESSLRRWGTFSQLLDYDRSKDTITVKVTIPKLTAEYVQLLLKAMEAKLKIKLFLIDLLGPEVFAYLDSKGITVDNLSNALEDFEKDPRGAATKSTLTLESFLYKLGQDTGVNVAKSSGIIELVDALRDNGKNPKILAKHQQIGYGLGGIRNIAGHDPDKESGKSWTVTPTGGLLTTLLVPAAIRSIYLYHSERRQEF